MATEQILLLRDFLYDSDKLLIIGIIMVWEHFIDMNINDNNKTKLLKLLNVINFSIIIL